MRFSKWQLLRKPFAWLNWKICQWPTPALLCLEEYRIAFSFLFCPNGNEQQSVFLFKIYQLKKERPPRESRSFCHFISSLEAVLHISNAPYHQTQKTTLQYQMRAFRPCH